MVLNTFEEMCDDESICGYCYRTDYGESRGYSTSNGYFSCEGVWCKESYESYLDNYDANEKLVKYQNSVKLLNKELII